MSYDTDAKALAAIPGVIREIIESLPDTRFDRCHFLNYGDTALQFEVVFFSTKPDFGTYADSLQKVNLAILERLRAMQVNFAAPARSVVYIESPAPGTRAAEVKS